jgi:hypothetical protein
MKATALLLRQHRALERLLTRLGRDKSLRLTLVLQLIEELLTHLSVEDHFFLCPVADATGIPTDVYREEQASVRNAMLQAVFVEADDEAFDQRLGELVAAFSHHAEGLEHDLLPLVEARLRADHLEAIGDRMQKFLDAAVGRGPTGSLASRAAAPPP